MFRAQWIDREDYFTNDGNHLNTIGLAAEAAQMWPVVAEVLKLPPQ